MTQVATAESQECTFCGTAAHEVEASTVYEDETVAAFMDRYPLTRGHLHVVPRHHAVGLEDPNENLPKTLDRDRRRLESDAHEIRTASAHRADPVAAGAVGPEASAFENDGSTK